jgi:hypothetical protein
MPNVYVQTPSPYRYLRAVCTCPACQTVWAHPETGRIKADAQAIHAMYCEEQVQQCPHCHEWSVENPGKGFFRQPHRELCPAPYSPPSTNKKKPSQEEERER